MTKTICALTVVVGLVTGFIVGQNTSCFNAFGLAHGCLFKVPAVK